MCDSLVSYHLQGWIMSSKWSENQDVVAKLTENLHRYVNYSESLYFSGPKI